MTQELAPTPHETRYLVWSDDRAARYVGGHSYPIAKWFWSASGPRGHMNGAENTAEAAEQRAYAAYALLISERENKASAAA